MRQVLLSFAITLFFVVPFPRTASAEKKETPNPGLVPAPALKGAGSVDLEDLLTKNPFPADAKGPLHFAPILFAKPPKSRHDYSIAGLHARGEMPMHKHKLRSEIVYVVAGTGAFFLGGETIALKPGLVLHVPAGTPHGFKLDGDGRVLMVAVGKFNPKDHHLVKSGAKTSSGAEGN
jgi:quercetin dioxygenase-like cupin family protein